MNAGLDYGMFKFPVVEGPGNPDILTGVPEGFVVLSKTKYPDECIAFLKWFLGPEVGKAQAQTIGWFNASKNVTEGVNDKKLLDGYKVITEAKIMGPWFDSALYSKARSFVDERLLKLNGNSAVWLAAEQRPFVEAMNQQMAETLPKLNRTIRG